MEDMIELARQYGRYGYRRIAALLRDAGWQINDKRVERLWRREGVKVPVKQPKKGRLCGLPQEAAPVSKLESGADSPASELAEAERKPG